MGSAVGTAVLCLNKANDRILFTLQIPILHTSVRCVERFVAREEEGDQEPS